MLIALKFNHLVGPNKKVKIKLIKNKAEGEEFSQRDAFGRTLGN